MSRSQLLEELGESFLGQHQSLRREKTGCVWETRKRPVQFFIILFCSFLVLRNVKKRILWKLGKKCSGYPTNNSAFSTYALTELTAIMNGKFWKMQQKLQVDIILETLLVRGMHVLNVGDCGPQAVNNPYRTLVRMNQSLFDRAVISFRKEPLHISVLLFGCFCVCFLHLCQTFILSHTTRADTCQFLLSLLNQV